MRESSFRVDHLIEIAPAHGKANGGFAHRGAPDNHKQENKNGYGNGYSPIIDADNCGNATGYGAASDDNSDTSVSALPVCPAISDVEIESGSVGRAGEIHKHEKFGFAPSGVVGINGQNTVFAFDCFFAFIRRIVRENILVKAILCKGFAFRKNANPAPAANRNSGHFDFHIFRVGYGNDETSPVRPCRRHVVEGVIVRFDYRLCALRLFFKQPGLPMACRRRPDDANGRNPRQYQCRNIYKRCHADEQATKHPVLSIGRFAHA